MPTRTVASPSPTAPNAEAGSRPRFRVTAIGSGKGRVHYVIDRAYCYRIVRAYQPGGTNMGIATPERRAKALCSALSLKHGPWPT